MKNKLNRFLTIALTGLLIVVPAAYIMSGKAFAGNASYKVDGGTYVWVDSYTQTDYSKPVYGCNPGQKERIYHEAEYRISKPAEYETHFYTHGQVDPDLSNWQMGEGYISYPKNEIPEEIANQLEGYAYTLVTSFAEKTITKAAYYEDVVLSQPSYYISGYETTTVPGHYEFIADTNNDSNNTSGGENSSNGNSSGGNNSSGNNGSGTEGSTSNKHVYSNGHVDATNAPYTKADQKNCSWFIVDGKAYWYENGVKQGTYDDAQGIIGDGTIRGREIYDPDSNAWYWLDSMYDGAKAVGKEVWIPYVYHDEASWTDSKIRDMANGCGDMADCVYTAMKKRAGKWVRYDENGGMLKGWVTISGALANYYPKQKGNTYYYDPITGLMARGYVTIAGVSHHFNDITGVLEW